MKLYQAAMSTCSQKVRFVLEQKELAWENITVDLHNAENYSSEFKKLNPKAIIPVLDDDGDLIIESNNICLYLDEKYPQTPLMPNTEIGRSNVRTLIHLIDEQVHNDISVCTYAMAFRERLRSSYDNNEKLNAYLANIPDAGRRHTKHQVIVHGTECPEFKIAITRIKAMLEMLDETLEGSTYLVGEQLTIADIAYSPYITRLDHLNMQALWASKKNITAWYQSLKKTKGYEKGIQNFFIESAIDNMRTAGGKFSELTE